MLVGSVFAYLGEDVDKRSEDASINGGLDLLLVTGRDVGHGPGSLLHQAHLVVVQQLTENRKCAGLDDGIRLLVTSGHDIADRPQGGGDNVHVLRGHEFHEKWDDSGIDNQLDPIVCTIRQVRQGPARIG